MTTFDLKKFGLTTLAVITLAFSSTAFVNAEDAAEKPAKPMTCKQEAKAQGLKGADAKNHIKECKKARKAAKKDADK